jgi:hypothetical protein
MSNYIKVNTEFFNTNLGPLEILVLSVIESYTRDNKQCYLTNDQLATMFNVSKTYIKNTLDTLEKKNYILRDTKVVRDGETGKAHRTRTIQLKHLKVERKFAGFSF